MKVWITKYALTDGIIEGDASMCVFDRATVDLKNSKYEIDFYGSDWHYDKESAIRQAEEMRQKKIGSLKKQIEKLEGMRFE